MRGVDSSAPEDHAASIVSEIELRFEEALALTAKLGPENFANFARHLDAAWIDEALLTTGTATLVRAASRRVRCRHCSVRIEQVPWARTRSRFTHQFEAEVLRDL